MAPALPEEAPASSGPQWLCKTEKPLRLEDRSCGWEHFLEIRKIWNHTEQERNPKEEWIQNKTGFLQSLVLTCVSRFVSSKIWMLHKHLYTSLYYPSVNCIDLEVFIDGPRGCQQADILFSSSTRQEPPEQAYSKGFGKDVISSAWSEAHVRGHMSKTAECKAVQCTFLFAFFVEFP